MSLLSGLKLNAETYRLPLPSVFAASKVWFFLSVNSFSVPVGVDNT